MALESFQPPAPELSLHERAASTPCWEDVPLLDLAGPVPCLTEAAAEVISGFCLEQAHTAAARVMERLERRLKPLVCAISELERQLALTKAANVDDLQNSIVGAQVILQKANLAMEAARERPAGLGASKSGWERDLRSRALAAQDDFSATCAALQTRLLELSSLASRGEPSTEVLEGAVARVRARMDELEELSRRYASREDLQKQRNIINDMLEYIDEIRATGNLEEVKASKQREVEYRESIVQTFQRYQEQHDLHEVSQARHESELQRCARREAEAEEAIAALQQRCDESERGLKDVQAQLKELDAFRKYSEQEFSLITAGLDDLAEQILRPEHRTPALWMSRLRCWVKTPRNRARQDARKVQSQASKASVKASATERTVATAR